MNILFSERGWEDYLYWQSKNKQISKRVNLLLRDICRDDPFDGIGKPEPLKHAFSGYWSRRINDEHRLIYRIVDDVVEIAQARYHY